ncbi:hypothetical protein SCE1572_40815 [Sorangium cellulosum So0157-2]|uniref:Uncharacterized protein n=1 Tax=Sorangium cellulosum So0157-2 TaxID=1254432 RepID=S4YBV9_SORCE|nr:hypothetical protein SCE1572_40815 [Sorangium cellulosum So0157-2]
MLSAEPGAVVVHLAELVAGEVREREAAAMSPSTCSSNRGRVEVNARDLRGRRCPPGRDASGSAEVEGHVGCC